MKKEKSIYELASEMSDEERVSISAEKLKDFIAKREGKQKCAFCGWLKKDHRDGRCYNYSDQDTDYFYKDKFFTATK